MRCAVLIVTVHIFSGDFKQLPPATSKAPFIVIPSVYENFDFRCLRQNRRVVSDENRREELEEFHQVLTDISLGIDSNYVRKFIIESYIRGADYSSETCEFDGNTSVFTKRTAHNALYILCTLLLFSIHLLSCQEVSR